ncbi:transglutaminase-like domain-containing protein [Paenibacillus arenilitoris]|uniref:Transglutaminase family protein n=1 Tax=Paenibacillus arenilitoris TaxID=2772299 RepID=A0A927H5Z6_9BACL|nr:transglutaminase family protein [Paenibacillus arenilitoris]MBD2869058.1 transglutaminase family protein [Paenibacillus arenilitoris]
MIFITESDSLEDYLAESEEVDFSHLSIREKAAELYAISSNDEEFIGHAYRFVRDEISHSWDIQSPRITRKASEVLYFKEGICYAKSHLLCAVLRSQGVPAGFCYQKLTLGDAPDTGYCVHALNAVFLKSLGRWIRLDARGNKPGVHAEFSLHGEQLAFPVREACNEIDYPKIYAHPHPHTIRALKQNTDCVQMCLHGLPAELMS